ncbi:hypothetical protein BDY24DRAFT_166714 [Mrakia frigida]|uniref:uncharacterized protein n=1 Tax=Mrakia frigida TaxID=29902 RepID=UPI003FCC1198
MHLLGFEAGVRVTGPRSRVLTEYNSRCKSENEQVCWLEAEAGETFEVFWRKTNQANKVETAGEVWVDGLVLCMGDAFLGAREKKEVQVRGPPSGEDSLLPLMFQDLNLKPEDAEHPYTSTDVGDLGTIQLRILLGHFTDTPVDFVKPTLSPWALPIYGKEKFEETNPGRSMFVGFGPERRAPRAGALTEWELPEGVVGYELTFTWSYRSRAALQLLYVIPRDPIAPPPPPPPDPEPERAASSVKRERSLNPLPPPPNQPVAGPSRPLFRRDSPIVIDDDSDSNSPPPRAPPSQRVPTPPSPKRVKRELSPIVFSTGRQSSRDEPIELSSDDDTAIEFVSKRKMKKLTELAEETRRAKIKADKVASRQKAQEANQEKLRTEQLARVRSPLPFPSLPSRSFEKTDRLVLPSQAEKIRLLKEKRDKAVAEEERLLAEVSLSSPLLFFV